MEVLTLVLDDELDQLDFGPFGHLERSRRTYCCYNGACQAARAVAVAGTGST